MQRNVGIDRTSGDPVFLIDDDVWLDPAVHDASLYDLQTKYAEVVDLPTALDYFSSITVDQR